MTGLLLAASIVLNVVLAIIILVQREELAALRIAYQEERAWSEQWQRIADTAEAQLRQQRQQCAVVQHWHAVSMVPVLGAAWRAELGKPGQ